MQKSNNRKSIFLFFLCTIFSLSGLASHKGNRNKLSQIFQSIKKKLQFSFLKNHKDRCFIKKLPDDIWWEIISFINCEEIVSIYPDLQCLKIREYEDLLNLRLVCKSFKEQVDKLDYFFSSTTYIGGLLLGSIHTEKFSQNGKSNQLFLGLPQSKVLCPCTNMHHKIIFLSLLKKSKIIWYRYNYSPYKIDNSELKIFGVENPQTYINYFGKHDLCKKLEVISCKNFGENEIEWPNCLKHLTVKNCQSFKIKNLNCANNLETIIVKNCSINTKILKEKNKKDVTFLKKMGKLVKIEVLDNIESSFTTVKHFDIHLDKKRKVDVCHYKIDYKTCNPL